MRVRRTRTSQIYRRRKIAAAVVLVALVSALTLIIACRTVSDQPEEAPQDKPQEAQDEVSEVTPPTSQPTPTDAPEATIEPTEPPWAPAEADIEYIAKTVYGEANIVRSTMRQAAVAWCILNRVDSQHYADTIEGVVTAPHQFSGYDPDHPVTDELRSLAVDVLQRWHREQNGETDVGRVLPKEYIFFFGDGLENYFTKEWKSEDCWEWELPSPYQEDEVKR